MSVTNRTPDAPRRARPRPARLVWILGLAVGIIGGAIVAYGLAEVTAGTAATHAEG